MTFSPECGTAAVHAPAATTDPGSCNPEALQLEQCNSVVAASSSTALAESCAADAVLQVQLYSPRGMVQALQATTGWDPEKKTLRLFAALVRNKVDALAVDLMREILWGAMLRAHAQQHPHMAHKQRPAALRKQLLESSDNMLVDTEAPIVSKDFLIKLHDRQRMSALLQSESDDLLWALHLDMPAFAAALSRDKMVALAKQEHVWQHLPTEEKWSFWRHQITTSRSAKQITANCEKLTGQRSTAQTQRQS